MNNKLLSLTVLACLLTATVGCTLLRSQKTDGKNGPMSSGTALFNGKDLSGWEVHGGATWKVENGNLIGTQGPGNAPGDLLTEATYRDFDLTVTYKIDWPANSGIWFRYQAPQKTYQADILEYKEPVAYSGTLYCPGKLFIAVNDNKDLVNREGWNTIRIRAQGDHLQVWLNGRQVGDAHDQTSDRGKIGFQIHAGDQFPNMKITVREVILQPLGKVQGAAG